MVHSFKKRLLNLFQRKANPVVAGYPYLSFQKIFQLYNSSIYEPFTPGSQPEDSIENPLALLKAVAAGVAEDVSDILENPRFKIEDVQCFRSQNDDWIIYGQGSLPDPEGKGHPTEHLFMTMLSTAQGADGDIHFAPYFLFDAISASSPDQALLLPQSISTLLKTEDNQVLTYEHDFPGEFGKALCFADAVFCKILAGQEVDLDKCQKWIESYPHFMCEQKIKYIERRDIHQLCKEIQSHREHKPQPIEVTI